MWIWLLHVVAGAAGILHPELALFMWTPGMSTYAQCCVGGPYTNSHFPHKSAEGLQKMRTEL